MSRLAQAANRFMPESYDINEGEAFPSNAMIEEAITSADKKFWEVILESFKQITDPSFEGLESKMQSLKQAQQNAVKEWLKVNWPKPE